MGSPHPKFLILKQTHYRKARYNRVQSDQNRMDYKLRKRKIRRRRDAPSFHFFGLDFIHNQS